MRRINDRLIVNNQGQGLLEYSLMISLASLVVIGAIILVRLEIIDVFEIIKDMIGEII